MRESNDPSGWRLAILTAVVLIGLALFALVRGPETDQSPLVATMSRVFHGAMLLGVVVFLTRLPALTLGRENRRAVTAALLVAALFAGGGLLARDFGII